MKLDKTLQVSDWNRPELLQEQLEYGAADAVVAFEVGQISSTTGLRRMSPITVEAYEFLRSLIYPLARQTEERGAVRCGTSQSINCQVGTSARQALAQLDIANPNSAKAEAGMADARPQ